MATPDFDYESFAQNLAQQAQELVPPEFEDYQKQYIINTLGNFSMLSGKAIAEDPNLNFNADQAVTITQIIAEWSFHKSVDLIRSGIPQQFWDPVMQKIAYTIFEIAKQAFSQGLPHEQMLELVEHHVKKSYVDAVTELRDKGAIDDGLLESAVAQSNMDKMAQEMQQQQAAGADGQPPVTTDAAGGVLPEAAQERGLPPVDSKVLKLATVAMLFKKVNQDKVQAILDKFNPDDAQAVIKYMKIPDLAQKVGQENALRCLQEIKMNLPKSTELNPNYVVLKLKKQFGNYSSKDLDTKLATERIGVKRLVFNALEGTYYDKMPPKVASIVATHISNSV